MSAHSEFNRGVNAVLSIAAAAAEGIRIQPGYRPTRSNFAIAVLSALAEEGRALLIPGPDEAGAIVQPLPQTSGSGGAVVTPEIPEFVRQ